MQKVKFILVVLTGILAGFTSSSLAAEPVSLEDYLLDYTYASRKAMKANSAQAIDLLEDGKAVLVDIRFKEEQQAWGVNFGLQIPLSELPKQVKHLPKDKIIITACPHKDRAIIAMVYLRTQGFDARYLTDGLIGLADNLRGEDALYFMDLLQQTQP